MRRLRARSTASSAPPKTLWSVTAIAPSPSASAWSSRSSTVIEQSCDQFVCMCRSATIQSRSSSGTTRCAARRRRFVIDSYTSSTRSARAGKLCFAAAPAPCSARFEPQVGVVDQPAGLRGGELRLEPPSRRRRDRRAGRLRLDDEPRQTVERGHEDGRVPEHLGPGLAVAGRADVDAAAEQAREASAARRAASCGAGRAPSRARRRARARSRAGAAAPPAAIRGRRPCASPPAGTGRDRRRAAPPGSGPGTARPRPPPSPRSSRAARRAGRAAARAAPCRAGSRAAPRRRTSRR